MSENRSHPDPTPSLYLPAPPSRALEATRDRAEPLVIDCNTALGEGVTWEPKTRAVNYDPAALLRYSAEAGIQRSCVAPARNKLYREKNKELAQLCEKYPEKFIGFAAHNPQAETGTLRQMLIEEVKSMGLKGLRTDGHPTREALDTAAELDIPVMYYPVLGVRDPSGGPWSTGPQVYTGPARAYYIMAKTYPSVNFILPHLGSYRSSEWLAHIEAIELAKRFPNVYVETSGVLSHKYLEMAVRELPIEKIVFGSNAPEEDPRVEMYAVELLGLTRKQQTAVLGGNLRRLLPPLAA
jgi:hypothetical protein